jgi:hypothetical protein
MVEQRKVVAAVGRMVNRALRARNLELRRLPPAVAQALASEPALARPEEGEPESIATPERDPFSTSPLHPPDELRVAFADAAAPIIERHRQQSVESIEALKSRYAGPIFGRTRVWDLVERLGCCIDPSDQRLYGASQQMHVLQMISEMEADGTATPEMVLVALIHDLGKLLLLTAEDPANIVCMNSPVGHWDPGSGLDNCVLQWNHDEFAYQRFKDLVPEDLAWLIRYHSVEPPDVVPLMDDRDRERTERLLKPFAHYDHATKTPFRLPSVSLLSYRDIIEEAFPHPILF